MQVKPEIPESLCTFALASVGSYSTRYDKILDEAFTHYQIILSAAILRQLAGGGSNSTAQEAIDRFRARLHKSLSSRIDFGVDIPEGVSKQMNAVMSELWTSCRQIAASDFDSDRARLETAVSAAAERESALACTVEAQAKRIGLLDAQIADLAKDNGELIAKVADLDAQTGRLAAQLVQQQSAFTSDLEAKDAEIGRLAFQLQTLKEQMTAAAVVHRTEKESQLQQFRIESSEVRREHAVAIERALKERDAAVAAERIERAGHAETTIKLAYADRSLAQLASQLLKANTTLQESQQTVEGLRAEIARLNGKIEDLALKLGTQEADQAKSSDQLQLLQDIHKKLTTAAVVDPLITTVDNPITP